MNKSNQMGLHDVAIERLKRASFPIMVVFCIVSIIALVLASISFVRYESAIEVDGGVGIVIPVAPIFTPYKNAVFYSTAGSGTWVCPTGIYYFKAEIMGGGGGGGGGGIINSQGAGGGSGAYAMNFFATIPGTQYAYTVGAGGGHGVTGGTSTFNGMKATGGIGSTGPNSAAGGTATGGQLNLSGFASHSAIAGSLYTGNGTVGASSPLGWGQCGTISTAAPTGDTEAVNGYDAVGYGAGGGGAYNIDSTHASTGGKGSGGFVMIEY